MLLQNKKVAVIGGGPGGLTLARLLQLKGIEVKVYERDKDKNARVQGSPLDLHENSGLAAMEKAGLMNEFRENFMMGADKTTIVNPQAEVLYSEHHLDKKQENFGDEQFRPEIDRGILRKILLESLEPETVVWDSHFMVMENDNEGWILHFKNGKNVYADLVVAADGANSKIRPYLTDVKAFYSGIIMLEGTVYDAETTIPKISSILKGGKIMAFGNEQNILMGQKAGGEVGFYFSFKADENWIANNTLDFSDRSMMLEWFKTNYSEWSDTWYELIEKTNIPFIPRPIYCMPLDQSWESKSNVTLLGDAAHLMPPFAGEGVNMAMLDALELCENLTVNNHTSILEAITDYESIMRARASVIAQESLDNGVKMHDKYALSNMLAFFNP